MAVHHPDWARRGAVYQINVRQFTPQGTLAALEAHLPRVAEMLGGQGILWFMPIQPIGVEQRKGTLGSYYSIRDYTAVNPEFGTLADFRRVVERAHALGLRVILDWVANHTAWDHAWTREHPDWYLKDEHGRIHSYVYRADPKDPDCTPEYWTDVVGLDWSQPALWEAMQASMEWWLHETGIDGFRCDVAALVPIAFWERMRQRLDALLAERGGVFMLAEAHEPVHHRAAFDATYDWDLFDQLKAIAAGRDDALALRRWWARRVAQYGPSDWRMVYTANHDSNSWQASCAELFGAGLDTPAGQTRFKAYAALAALLPGLPLVYGGQESYFDKRLAFFEKDPIDWKDLPLQAFYRSLLSWRSGHPALGPDNDPKGLQWLDVGNDQVAAFRRTDGAGASIDVLVNLSANPQTAIWPAQPFGEPERPACARASSPPVPLAPGEWRVSA